MGLLIGDSTHLSQGSNDFYAMQDVLGCGETTTRSLGFGVWGGEHIMLKAVTAYSVGSLS